VNGNAFDEDEAVVVEKTLGLAAGEVSEADYAEWLRLSCCKKKKGKG
jgi:hypothetical protein